MKTTGAAAMMLAMPDVFLAALSGLSDDEIEKRVQELLGKMTLDEKIAQMHGISSFNDWGWAFLVPSDLVVLSYDTAENKRLGIPAFKMVSGPRGIGRGTARGTCFPVEMARGASWEPALEEKVGEVMGYETRAVGCNVQLSPCMNVLYHPSWGRAQETYGEDPYHLGRMAVGYVVGTQQYVMTSVKHFAVNNIDNSRYFVNAVVDERTLREIFLPHFKMSIDAGAATVMSSYNHLNGPLAGQNHHLITDILKNEWGFKGLVMSDWVQAVRDTVAAANAGLDLEMPTGAHFGKPLKKAVQDGLVSEQTIDQAVTRILRCKFKFLPPDYTAGFDRKKVGGKEFARIARETEQKSLVLLKNDRLALPLRRGQVKTILVLGKLADTANTGDLASSLADPPYVITPLQGLKNLGGDSVKIIYDPGRNSSRVRALAKLADAVVIVAGLTWRDESEGVALPVFFPGDRLDLNLPPDQEELIKAASEASQRVIVILEGGSAITMESWKDQVEAIVMAWYPGMEGGNAIAEALFGEVNPSGKLPIVFPKSRDQLKKFDPEAKEVAYDRYYGYRWFDQKGLEPAFPFGFGLSYTTYQYRNLKLDQKTVGQNGKIIAQVEVTNTGKMSGEEIVQLYVGAKGSRVDRCVKELKAFAKIPLQPGETRTVALELKAADLAYYNLNTNAWEVEEIEYTVMVGPSSRPEDLKLSDNFKIAGA